MHRTLPARAFWVTHWAAQQIRVGATIHLGGLSLLGDDDDDDSRWFVVVRCMPSPNGTLRREVGDGRRASGGTVRA
ncbi:hypothetical protein VTK73DRAFT_8392 [Phialemonium thermophilum]|uniref:Uncharacterized protein n=1 Tax=Phialemonium thermophilum TaxID=223376 RepID=A0ABR3W951_9PEZI